MRAVLLVLLLFLAACEEYELPDEQPNAPETVLAQCPVCPEELCMTYHCGESTGFECVGEEIVPCCGNGICEPGEEGCLDCPECIPGTCERAEFDYDIQECVIEQISPCCGNGICESGEEGCPDCPECATDRLCHVSVYDFAAQACVEKPVVPCCGNGICDRGETCTTCSADCVCSPSADLSKFPGFLSKGTLIVVGDTSTSYDVITATAITTSLMVKGIETESDVLSMISQAKLDSSDLIVLGSPCENALWQSYMGVACDPGYLEKDRALVKLLLKGSRKVVFIAGHSPSDTNKAALALLDDLRLSGYEAELDTSGNRVRVI